MSSLVMIPSGQFQLDRRLEGGSGQPHPDLAGNRTRNPVNRKACVTLYTTRGRVAEIRPRFSPNISRIFFQNFFKSIMLTWAASSWFPAASSNSTVALEGGSRVAANGRAHQRRRMRNSLRRNSNFPAALCSVPAFKWRFSTRLIPDLRPE